MITHRCQDLVFLESSPGISMSNCSNKLLLAFVSRIGLDVVSSGSSGDLHFLVKRFFVEQLESSSM